MKAQKLRKMIFSVSLVSGVAFGISNPVWADAVKIKFYQDILVNISMEMDQTKEQIAAIEEKIEMNKHELSELEAANGNFAKDVRAWEEAVDHFIGKMKSHCHLNLQVSDFQSRADLSPKFKKLNPRELREAQKLQQEWPEVREKKEMMVQIQGESVPYKEAKENIFILTAGKDKLEAKMAQLRADEARVEKQLEREFDSRRTR